jgi:hypothetical protein
MTAHRVLGPPQQRLAEPAPTRGGVDDQVGDEARARAPIALEDDAPEDPPAIVLVDGEDDVQERPGWGRVLGEQW